MQADNAMREKLRQCTTAGALPGVVTMAADRAGVIPECSIGAGEDCSGQALSPDSLFWIASMSKGITTAAALQLAEQGRIELDAPAGDWVAYLAEARVLDGFDADGTPQLRPARRPITLRHLLTHTAGFGYPFSNADLRRYVEQADMPSRAGGAAASYRMPLVFDPGERWHYGINTDWAGQVIEAVTGTSLQTVLQTHILDPLGMTSTTFLPNDDQREHLLPMARRQEDDTLKPMRMNPPTEAEFFSGGGGLYSTPADYMRFLRMLLGDGEFDGVRVLQPDSVRLMQQNQIGDMQAGRMQSAQGHITRDIDLHPGMAQRWSLAFLINTEATPEGRSAGSMAWAGLGNTYFWLDPFRQVAGLFMTQVMPFGDPTALELFRSFEADVYRRLGADA